MADLSDERRVENFHKHGYIHGDGSLVTNNKYWIAEIEEHALLENAGIGFGLDAVLQRSVAVSSKFRPVGFEQSLVNAAASAAKAMDYKTICCLV